MMSRIRLDEWTSPGLGDVAPRATLVFPIGATEQHGPHLPVGVDAIVAAHIAEAAARSAGTESRPVLVAPVLAFGSSDHHLPRAGTLSLSSTTMQRALTELLSSAARTGFRRLLVLNGHGGNDDLAGQAARDVALRHPVVAAAVSYWSLAWDEVAELATRYDIAPVPGHAGAFETSLLLALNAGLVDQAAVRPHGPVTDPDAGYAAMRTAVHRHGWVETGSGYTDGASTASEAAGRAIIDLVVNRTSALITALAGEDQPAIRE